MFKTIRQYFFRKRMDVKNAALNTQNCTKNVKDK